MNFQIGADPEIFLQNKEGKFKSVIGLIGGDKWHPRKLTEDGHAVLEDNVAVEFNIPPCSTLADFRQEINRTMGMVRNILPTDLLFNECSAVSFPDDELACDAAWVFGCEPDLNAWTLEENPRPETEDKNLRSAGGHIHVGSDIAINNPIHVVRAMDVFLGVPSTRLDTAGGPRRKLYGKPGAFRFKPYGVEYRTLSNFWIFSDNLLEWAYEGTRRALEFVSKGGEVSDAHNELVHNCIMNNDQHAYNTLMQHYKV